MMDRLILPQNAQVFSRDRRDLDPSIPQHIGKKAPHEGIQQDLEKISDRPEAYLSKIFSNFQTNHPNERQA